jgi:AmmeMemoRadiSam system protein B
MSPLDRPQLRPHLDVAPQDGRLYLLHDKLRLSDAGLGLTPLGLRLATLFDGRRTLREMQVEVLGQTGGQTVPLEVLAHLAEQLEQALFLEGPRYRARVAEWVREPIRRPSCIGCYEGEPDALRRQIEHLFTGPGGPGLPGERPPAPADLRAALVPHIDYTRGGSTYAWIFKEVFEQTPASLFVIVGTSHHSRQRFTLTRKHFQTPLGVVPTDGDYIDRLVARYGAGLFDDEVAHLPEHSIELEVVFLQYLYAGRRPIRIVPLLVGSFHDCIESGKEPAACTDVGRMVEALRAVEQDTVEPICYLISGDLAHLGPKFGDPYPVGEPQLAVSRAQDQTLLDRAAVADLAGYFGVIAEEGDARRICGLPPTYTVLQAVRPSVGKVLHYDQHVHPQGRESVSFAGMAFYR